MRPARAAAVALCAASLIGLPAQASVAVCGWPETLPSADACAAELRAASVPSAGAAASSGASADAVAAWLARADALREADDLPAAGRALACAAAQPGAADDLRRRYEVVRRLGIVDYGLARPVEALGRFECALTLARRLEDRAETARQLRNVGSSLRRIGDYAGAMRALTGSLRLQREAGDDDVGPVLNNIADVYRELEQRDDAERYYREALAAFRASGDVVQAMHVYDSLADLAIDRRDTRAANALLEDALRDLRGEAAREGGEAGALRYQLLIRAGLIRAALAAGDVAAARAHLGDALALADAHGLALPAQLQLEAARTERLSGRGEAALARLRTAVAASADVPAQQALLLRELSSALQAAGREGDALDALRRAFELETEDLRAQRDRGLAWSNARLNLNESRRKLAEAEARSQRRTLQLWLTAASALAALALLALLFQRRHQRARQVEAVRRARYEDALARYRREYAALAEDRQLLQALLDSRDDALVLTDGDGMVQAANRAACDMLRTDAAALAGASLADGFAPESAQALRAALERMEDVGALTLPPALTGDGTPLQLELRTWEGGDGKVVVALRRAGAQAQPGEAGPSRDGAAVRTEAQADMQADTQTGRQTDRARTDAGLAGRGHIGDADAAVADALGKTDATEDSGAQRQRFRRELVELMLALVDAWERSTGLNRIELAERSRIWRVNIDDGRLRARAMERYLSLSKLPRNPRWRDVLRSAYFVLSNCEAMPAPTREDLQARIDRILAAERREALGES